jgi:hypothetical protein
MWCDAINSHVEASNCLSNAQNFDTNESYQKSCHQSIVHHITLPVLYQFSVSKNLMQAMWCGTPTSISLCNAIQAQCDAMPMHSSHQLHCCLRSIFNFQVGNWPCQKGFTMYPPFTKVQKPDFQCQPHHIEFWLEKKIKGQKWKYKLKLAGVLGYRLLLALHPVNLQEVIN